MNNIKIIPAIGLIKKLKGMGIINFYFFIVTHYTFLIPLIVIPCLFFGVIKFSQLIDIQFLISLAITSILGYFGIKYLYLPGNYIPYKSFFLERLSKEKINKISLVAISITFLFALYSYLVKGHLYYQYFIVFFVLYIYLKSLKVHGDIDYSANELLSEIIGVSIDEKIIASYQNFDGTNERQKKDDNLIVVTNRKIFFAVFDGKKWMTMSKLIQDIEKIGIARNDVNSYLKLIFNDNTSLGLRLELYEKITTTPQLFIKQFLNVLDASIMGVNLLSNTNRRRVSVDNVKVTSTTVSKSSTRNIELNPNLLNELKKSEEIKPGRILEI
jgi:hypothetical protein